MNKEEPPLTRDDFPDKESWLRHCYEGGIDLAREDSFAGVAGTGLYGHRLGAIYGPSRRAYQRTWEGWGTSAVLRTQQVKNAYKAVAFANCLGWVLDSTMDITWSLHGIVTDLDVAAKQRAFLDAIRRWFERNGMEAIFMWAIERGNRHGLHTHINLCVPRHLHEEFERYAKQRLARVVGGALIDQPDQKTTKIQLRDARNIVGQWRRFAYLMKGSDKAFMWLDKANPAKSITLEQRLGQRVSFQGMVSRKRAGVSRFLDNASRREWAAINAFPDMTIHPVGPLFDDRFLQWSHENAAGIKQPLSNKRKPGPTNGNDQ